VSDEQPPENTGPARGGTSEAKRSDSEAESIVNPIANGLVLKKASELNILKLEWLWEGRIPCGFLTLLAGWPGQGKSMLTNWLAARLSRGDLPGDLYGTPVASIIATAEDHPQTSVLPRLYAADAEMGLVEFITVGMDGFEHDVNLPYNVDLLREAVERTRARFIVIDPFMAHLDMKHDSYKDQHVRRALAPLAALVEEKNLAAILVHHFNKTSSENAFMRSGGSIGISAAVRSTLFMGGDPADEQDERSLRRALVNPKNNLAPAAVSLRLHIEPREFTYGDLDDLDPLLVKTAVVVLDGDAPEITVQDLLRDARRNRSSPALEEAKVFLQHELAEGPARQKETLHRAKDNGISASTLRRAKENLGVSSFEVEGAWWWRLPPAV
jgi:RecA-family ATPase